MSVFKDPIPGIPIIATTTPKADEVLVGYRLVEPPSGIVCKPDPTKLAWHGWASVALLAVLFWPVSCVPCCMTCSYKAYQKPVFEMKSTAGFPDEEKVPE